MAVLDLARVPRALLIDGQWREHPELPRFAVENPATGEVIAELPDAGPAQGAEAESAAERALAGYAALTPAQRSGILLKAHALLLEAKEELAAIMTAEMGKPFAEACGEVEYSAGYLHWFAQEAVRVQGSHAQSPSGRGQILLTREPVGVTMIVTPWNFPLAMGARKIAPAIATGCPVIVKPAALTPLTMLFFARLLEEAGVPAGAVNVLTTKNSNALVEPLLRGGVVRHLSFTGSTQVGTILHGQCSERMVRTSLELGGNAPFIVFSDADLDRAVQEAFAAKMRNMGEACTAANRILVHESVAEEFGVRLARRFAALRVGDGLVENIEVGPMIDAKACTRIQEFVDDAVQRGAEVLTGGTISDGPGHFYPPTVLTKVPRDARMMHEEVFGPVAPIITFSDESDAVALANDTEYGLAGYLMTEDLATAMRVSRALQLGMVGINSGIISDVAAPLGGVKSSGLGREGGILGIDEFLEYKYIFIPND